MFNPVLRTTRLTACALGLALATASLAVRAQATEPGELWEITTEMQMAGMSMPANKQQVCSPKNKPEAQGIPDNKDSQCETYDMKTSGSTTSWKMRCPGPPPTSGNAEITYQGKDAYRGQMAMKTGSDEMTMKMAGRRLGTACDAGAVKKQVAAIQAQSAKAMDDQCKGAVESMSPYFFSASSPYKCDPKYKAQFCARVKTEDGYDKIAPTLDPKVAQSMGGMALDATQLGALCGLSVETTRVELCNKALASESLVFVGRNCPTEGKDLAVRECAGRGYTTPVAKKYVEFCSAYARHGLLAGQAPAGDAAAEAAKPQTPASKAGDAIDAGKKKLRSIIGF